MGVLSKVRSWIDGDSAETVLEQAAKDAQVKPRSNAEEFIVKLARGVEEVMQREMVPLPQGTTLIPTEYIIFLSDEDDKDWQGAKRRGLEQGLYHVLAERAKEISGKKKLETQSFAVELRVDGTLEKGDIRIQHSWDDASSGKTGVIARGKPQQQQQQPVQPRIANQVIPMQNQPVVPAPYQQQPSTVANYQQPATVAQSNLSQKIPTNQEFEEATRVKKRSTELYKLEIWRGGVRQNIVPIFQNEVGIGRGSKSKPVDVPLGGDPEISRRHITIVCNGNGNYWLVSEGRNSTFVSNREVPMGQRVQISAGEPITVCSYLLRIQPK
ncbi:MAG: FHA domain-containing protein [Pyrinomonadaceae bacterium]|nr:FHA domain-containing protein [Pyrinomonadaceae bacterium]